jgi:hypothetical protein
MQGIYVREGGLAGRKGEGLVRRVARATVQRVSHLLNIAREERGDQIAREFKSRPVLPFPVDVADQHVDVVRVAALGHLHGLAEGEGFGQ